MKSFLTGAAVKLAAVAMSIAIAAGGISMPAEMGANAGVEAAIEAAGAYEAEDVYETCGLDDEDDASIGDNVLEDNVDEWTLEDEGGEQYENTVIVEFDNASQEKNGDGEILLPGINCEEGGIYVYDGYVNITLVYPFDSSKPFSKCRFEVLDRDMNPVKLMYDVASTIMTVTYHMYDTSLETSKDGTSSFKMCTDKSGLYYLHILNEGFTDNYYNIYYYGSDVTEEDLIEAFKKGLNEGLNYAATQEQVDEWLEELKSEDWATVAGYAGENAEYIDSLVEEAIYSLESFGKINTDEFWETISKSADNHQNSSEEETVQHIAHWMLGDTDDCDSWARKMSVGATTFFLGNYNEYLGIRQYWTSAGTNLALFFPFGTTLNAARFILPARFLKMGNTAQVALTSSKILIGTKAPKTIIKECRQIEKKLMQNVTREGIQEAETAYRNLAKKIEGTKKLGENTKKNIADRFIRNADQLKVIAETNRSTGYGRYAFVLTDSLAIDIGEGVKSITGSMDEAEKVVYVDFYLPTANEVALYKQGLIDNNGNIGEIRNLTSSITNCSERLENLQALLDDYSNAAKVYENAVRNGEGVEAADTLLTDLAAKLRKTIDNFEDVVKRQKVGSLYRNYYVQHLDAVRKIRDILIPVSKSGSEAETSVSGYRVVINKTKFYGAVPGFKDPIVIGEIYGTPVDQTNFIGYSDAQKIRLLNTSLEAFIESSANFVDLKFTRFADEYYDLTQRPSLSALISRWSRSAVSKIEKIEKELKKLGSSVTGYDSYMAIFEELKNEFWGLNAQFGLEATRGNGFLTFDTLATRMDRISYWFSCLRTLEGGGAQLTRSEYLLGYIRARIISINSAEVGVATIDRALDRFTGLLTIIKNRYESGVLTGIEAKEAYKLCINSMLRYMYKARSYEAEQLRLLVGTEEEAKQSIFYAEGKLSPTSIRDQYDKLWSVCNEYVAQAKPFLNAEEQMALSNELALHEIVLNGLDNVPNSFLSIGEKAPRVVDRELTHLTSQSVQSSYDRMLKVYKETLNPKGKLVVMTEDEEVLLETSIAKDYSENSLTMLNELDNDIDKLMDYRGRLCSNLRDIEYKLETNQWTGVDAVNYSKIYTQGKVLDNCVLDLAGGLRLRQIEIMDTIAKENLARLDGLIEGSSAWKLSGEIYMSVGGYKGASELTVLYAMATTGMLLHTISNISCRVPSYDTIYSSAIDMLNRFRRQSNTVVLVPAYTATMTGTVVDKTTGKPVEGASVSLDRINTVYSQEGAYTATTDRDGRFSIKVRFDQTMSERMYADSRIKWTGQSVIVDYRTGNALVSITHDDYGGIEEERSFVAEEENKPVVSPDLGVFELDNPLLTVKAVDSETGNPVENVKFTLTNYDGYIRPGNGESEDEFTISTEIIDGSGTWEIRVPVSSWYVLLAGSLDDKYKGESVEFAFDGSSGATVTVRMERKEDTGDKETEDPDDPGKNDDDPGNSGGDDNPGGNEEPGTPDDDDNPGGNDDPGNPGGQGDPGNQGGNDDPQNPGGQDDEHEDETTTGNIDGLVVDAESGSPLKGAKIILKRNKDSMAVSVVYTDENGSYLVRNVEEGPYIVTAEKDGYESGTINVTAVRNATEAADTIKLEPQCAMSGKITDGDGKGIAGAEIILEPTGGDGGDSRKTVNVKTDSDGHYSAEIRHGKYTAEVLADGYRTVTRTIEADGREETADFELERKEFTVRFTLLDSDGNAEKNKNVTVRFTGDDKGITAASDENGRVSVTHATGEYKLSISYSEIKEHGTFITSVSCDNDGEVIDLGTIRIPLRPSLTINGVVGGYSGKEYKEYTVVVYDSEGVQVCKGTGTKPYYDKKHKKWVYTYDSFSTYLDPGTYTVCVSETPNKYRNISFSWSGTITIGEEEQYVIDTVEAEERCTNKVLKAYNINSDIPVTFVIYSDEGKEIGRQTALPKKDKNDGSMWAKVTLPEVAFGTYWVVLESAEEGYVPYYYAYNTVKQLENGQYAVKVTVADTEEFSTGALAKLKHCKITFKDSITDDAVSGLRFSCGYPELQYLLDGTGSDGNGTYELQFVTAENVFFENEAYSGSFFFPWDEREEEVKKSISAKTSVTINVINGAGYDYYSTLHLMRGEKVVLYCYKGINKQNLPPGEYTLKIGDGQKISVSVSADRVNEYVINITYKDGKKCVEVTLNGVPVSTGLSVEMEGMSEQSDNGSGRTSVDAGTCEPENETLMGDASQAAPVTEENPNGGDAYEPMDPTTVRTDLANFGGTLKFWPLAPEYGKDSVTVKQSDGNGEAVKRLEFILPAIAEVYAADDGTVVYSGYTLKDGNGILIDLGNGTYLEYTGLSLRNVKEGDEIDEGERIGLTGKPGENGSTFFLGILLSDTDWENGLYICPVPYLFPEGYAVE